MKRHLKAAVAIAAVAACCSAAYVPLAHADLFTATFTCNANTLDGTTCEAFVAPGTLVSFPAPTPFSFTVYHLDSAQNVLATYGSSANMLPADQPGDLYQYLVHPDTGDFAFSDVTQTGNDLFANNVCQANFYFCGTLAFVATVPEPAPLVLVLTALRALVATRIGGRRSGN
jgi:hypothetical protein